MNENIFAIVPLEVLSDKRLTLWHIKVLVALLSFRSKNTDTVWPSRETLSERCGGMHVSNISKVTGELCDLGWLVKQGDGGNGRASRYKIVVPDLSTPLADSATVADSATHPPQIVAESATHPLADSARGIEQTIELTNKGNRQGARAMLEKRGVSGKLADAWIKVRHAKRLAITDLALDAIQREAVKVGLSFEQAIQVCCENSWAGFKAHWPRDGGAGASQTKQGAPPWYSSEALILAKGNELGLSARPGESMGDFKGRINAKITLSTGNGVTQGTAG